MKKNITTVFMILLSSSPTFAANLPENMRQSMLHDYGMPSLVQLVLSMVFVIALIYFTGWFYQKLNLLNRHKITKLSSNFDKHRFTVLQSMPLGQQRHLYSIKVADKILLVGSTPSHISLIKEFDADTVADCKEKSDTIAVANADTQEKSSLNIDELYKKYKN